MRALLERLGGRRRAAPTFLLCLALALAAGLSPARVAGSPTEGSASGPGRERAPSRPNIVVVMADDMRADDLVFAPQVRRLVARRGITFRNAFSPYPLCCPARASFLTGQLAHNHKVWSHERPWGYGSFDDSRTLATSLKAVGYRTGYAGKYLNGYGNHRSRVGDRPSHTYVPRGWTDWRASLDGGPRIHGGTYNYMDTPYNVNGRVDNSHRGDYSAVVTGGFARDMVTRFSRDRSPFFLYVNFLAPHSGGPPEVDDPGRLTDRNGTRYRLMTPARPRWVRGRYDDLVNRASGLPRGGGPAERNISDKPHYLAALPEPTRRERRAMRELTRQRAESIFAMDREIAGLVARLKRTGEWDDTVFVFTSDNGYYQGEHRRREGKVRAHEPSLRVPLLITGPGLRSGSHRDDPVTTVDLSATVLDLGRAQPPRRADGVSAVPTLRGGDRGWTTPVLNESIYGSGKDRDVDGFDDRRTTIGVRTARYSYIDNRSGRDELYDLKRDPVQERNVVGDDDYRPVRRLLREVWWDVRNCRGAGCQVDLPPELQATPSQLAALTDRYWTVLRRTYGFR